QEAVLDPVHRGSRQNGVSDAGVDFVRPFFQQASRGFHKGTRRVDHIVEHYGGFAGDFTDNIERFGLVDVRSALVDHRKAGPQEFGVGARSRNSSGVGGNNDQLPVEVLPDVGKQYRRGIEVVHG